MLYFWLSMMFWNNKFYLAFQIVVHKEVIGDTTLRIRPPFPLAEEGFASQNPHHVDHNLLLHYLGFDTLF